MSTTSARGGEDFNLRGRQNAEVSGFRSAQKIWSVAAQQREPDNREPEKHRIALRRQDRFVCAHLQSQARIDGLLSWPLLSIKHVALWDRFQWIVQEDADPG